MNFMEHIQAIPDRKTEFFRKTLNQGEGLCLLTVYPNGYALKKQGLWSILFTTYLQ